MIKEVIVVEGRNDITKVKQAVDAEVIATGGLGYGEEFIKNLKKIAKTQGIIILTDPDYAGEKIRRDLSKHIKNCKHAFLPKDKVLKEGDIGVENATCKDIIGAIDRAKPVTTRKRQEFTREDLILLGLSGGQGARERREKLGAYLGIGYGNSKQFLNRLNNFGITREDLVEAIKVVDLDE